MIKLLFFIAFLTPSTLLFTSLEQQTTRPKNSISEAFQYSNKQPLKGFTLITDEGSLSEDYNKDNAYTTFERFTNFATAATASAVSAISTITTKCSLKPTASSFYNMSQEDLDKFIQSKATTANQYNGYHEIENAILTAIDTGDKNAAILLFHKVYEKKSYFTPEALKKISEVTKEYQKDINTQLFQHLLLYAEQTVRTTHMHAESNKIDGPSSFKRQDQDEIPVFIKDKIKEILTFASKDLNASPTK